MIHLQELTHENHSLENQTSRESDITAHAVWFSYKNWLIRIIHSRVRHHCSCCMIHLQELTHENHSLENQTSLLMLYDSSTRTGSWESVTRESDITAHAVWFIYKNWLMRIIRSRIRHHCSCCMIHLQELTHKNHSLESQTSLLMLYDSSTRTDSRESFARESDITAHAVWFIYKNWLMRISHSRIRHHCPCCMIHLQELTHENHSLESQTSLLMLYDSSTRTDSWESDISRIRHHCSCCMIHLQELTHKNHSLESQTSLLMLYDSSTRTDSRESVTRESDITARAVWFIYKNWLTRIGHSRIRHHCPCCMIHLQELTHENHSLENQTSLLMLYDSSTRTGS